MPERIPREYSPVVFEKIIGTLLRRIENLENAQTAKKIGSIASDAAPLLKAGELAYMRDDSQNLSLVVKADDGRIYTIGALAATSSSAVSSPATQDHSQLSNLDYASSGHTGFVSDAGDTITGAVTIDGSADVVQLTIQGNATQTSELLVLENSAGTDQITMKNTGAAVFNEDGNSVDFRVESNTDANCLKVTGTADTVQVGASSASDSAKFYVSGKISASGEVEINGDLNHDGSNVGFYGTAPASQPAALTQTYSTADRTLSAYTADDESSAYTGIDNLQLGSVYAQVSDLNSLRTAYENLRAFTEDAVAFLNALIDDFQLNGLEQ